MKRPVFFYLIASIFTSLSFMGLSQPTQAQVAVFDASSYSQMLAQLDTLSRDYQKQLEQLQQAVRQADALTGPRNMGSLNNSTLEAELRRYLPTTWQETMNMMNSPALGTATGTQNIYSNLTTTFQPLSGAEFLPHNPTGPIAQAVDRRNNTTYAAMAASEQAYNNISARIDTYENMLTQLDSTADLKASVDLQARIAAENGLILNELLRLQAMQMQQQAATDNQVLTTYRRAATANSYDPAKAAKAFSLEE